MHPAVCIIFFWESEFVSTMDDDVIFEIEAGEDVEEKAAAERCA